MSHHTNPNPILLDVSEDKVALLTMNRPDTRNSLHPDLIEAMSQALNKISSRDDINSVIPAAIGPAFCAGLDLEHLQTLSSEDQVEYMRSPFSLFQQLYHLPQPAIAAINGPAIAGGFDLAVFSDLRISVPEARFAQPEIILGATQFLYPLYTLIGLVRAKELALTGNPISAEEAYRTGLVNHLVSKNELISKAKKLAITLANRPRETLLATKQLSFEIPSIDADSTFKTMGEALVKSLSSNAHHPALDAYINVTLRKCKTSIKLFQCRIKGIFSQFYCFLRTNIYRSIA